MAIPDPSTPRPVAPADHAWRIATFRIAVGETQSSRVVISGPYALRALRWPASGLTAATFRLAAAATLDGPLLEIVDVGDTTPWTIAPVAGKQTAVPTSVGVGAGPVIALVGNVAQTGSEAVVEGVLVPA